MVRTQDTMVLPVLVLETGTSTMSGIIVVVGDLVALADAAAIVPVVSPRREVRLR